MSIFKNSAIYVVSEVATRAIPFFLLPILTSYLSPVEYGIYGMYQVLLSFLSPFIMMNMQTNITRNFFKVTKEELSRILSSLILLIHMHLFVGMIILYFVTQLFHNPFGVPDRMIYIMPVIIYAQTINTYQLTILRNNEQAIHYGVMQFVITAMNFGMAMLLLLAWNQGWESLVYGTLFAHGVMLFYSVYQMKSEYELGWKLYDLKKIYAISLPLVLHLLGGSIIFLSDRLFVQQMLGIKEVGLYTVGNQFGMITMILINALVMAVNPWMYRHLAKENQEVVSRSYMMMGIFVLVGIVVWLGALVVFPFVIDSRYVEAKGVIFWISMAFVLRGFYQIMYNVIVHHGKTGFFMYMTFGTGLINIILNYFLIPIDGMTGAAEATCIAFLMMFVVTWIYADKHSKLNWIRYK